MAVLKIALCDLGRHPGVLPILRVGWTSDISCRNRVDCRMELPSLQVEVAAEKWIKEQRMTLGLVDKALVMWLILGLCGLMFGCSMPDGDTPRQWKPAVWIMETWRCFGLSDYNKATALFTLIRVRSGGEDVSGRVSVAGVTHLTRFQVAGLNRRWDWGGHQYAFVIEPDGTGAYYDFSVFDSVFGDAKPSQVFECQLSPYQGGTSHLSPGAPKLT